LGIGVSEQVVLVVRRLAVLHLQETEREKFPRVSVMDLDLEAQ
jgi:hypothetical protein